MKSVLKPLVLLLCLALLCACGDQSAEVPPAESPSPSAAESSPAPTLFRGEAGYTVAYDPDLYQLRVYEESVSFWCGVGLYLSVSFLPDTDAEYAVTGLRLQEDIENQPETLSVGTGRYAAQSLQYTDDRSNFRRFWVLEHCGGILLLEQSVPEAHPEASLHRATQQVMLDSLTLTN